METAKVKQQKGSAKRPDEMTAAADPAIKKSSAGLYYLFSVLLFILKLSVILVMIFSLQNLSDMLRAVPFLNSLPPFPALVFSYFAIHVFCIYFFIVWFGSFKGFFKRLGPTLIEIKGFLIYTVLVPLLFVLLAGGVWWSVSRVKIAAIIGFPFQWLPNLISGLYLGGWPFFAFASLTTALLIALMFLVVALQGPVRNMKPAPSGTAAKASSRKAPVVKDNEPDIDPTVDSKDDGLEEKPIQPKGQPPLHMK